MWKTLSKSIEASDQVKQLKMKVEERIEEYLYGDSNYQSISDFYCNATQWER